MILYTKLNISELYQFYALESMYEEHLENSPEDYKANITTYSNTKYGDKMQTLHYITYYCTTFDDPDLNIFRPNCHECNKVKKSIKIKYTFNCDIARLEPDVRGIPKKSAYQSYLNMELRLL